MHGFRAGPPAWTPLVDSTVDHALHQVRTIAVQPTPPSVDEHMDWLGGREPARTELALRAVAANAKCGLIGAMAFVAASWMRSRSVLGDASGFASDNRARTRRSSTIGLLTSQFAAGDRNEVNRRPAQNAGLVDPWQMDRDAVEAHTKMQASDQGNGGGGRIRTCDLRVMSPLRLFSTPLVRSTIFGVSPGRSGFVTFGLLRGRDRCSPLSADVPLHLCCMDAVLGGKPPLPGVGHSECQQRSIAARASPSSVGIGHPSAAPVDATAAGRRHRETG